MNDILILVAAILVLGALVIFLIIRNKKDRRDLTETLNQDYKKSKDIEKDIDLDEKI